MADFNCLLSATEIQLSISKGEIGSPPTEVLASSSQVSSIGGGGAGMLNTYIMEAKDSITGAIYNWSVNSSPDFVGAGYPGPNLPTQIAIRSILNP
jgi:hypothetical protein